MKWAAAILAALCALCLSTSLHAEDFTSASVKAALTGFGESFRTSNCFIGKELRKVSRIAVAQMKSMKFKEEDEDTISEWIEDALTEDKSITVVGQRERWELDETNKELGKRLSPAANDVDGIVTIKVDPGRVITVVAWAYVDGQHRRCLSKSIPVGRIVETPDEPGKFFEHAAKKLPADRTIEKVVVMPPDVTGLGNAPPARFLGQKLQQQLADGITQVVQERAGRSVGNFSGPREVLTYAEGMDVSRAWQARLRAGRSQQGGIEVRVDFRDPDGRSGPLSDRGYLELHVPADSDPAVVAFAEAACSKVRQAIATQTDPDALQAMGREGLCPRLDNELAEKEQMHRDRICSEDRAHWRAAMTSPAATMESMELVASSLRCRRVADDAQKDLRQRRETDMKSAAVDLGPLPDGRTVERKASVGGAVATGIWRLQMTVADTLEVQLDDLTASVAVDLLDSSGNAVGTRHQSGPRRAEISTANKLDPGEYYIRVAADGRQGSFTLRVAKGWIDTAGDTVETARDLGGLGPGEQTIRKRIGGTDRGDVYKFTTQERVKLQLTAGDMTSDIQLDLLNQSGQVIQWRRGRDRQLVEWSLEPQSTWYVAVRAAGEITPYSLGIVLSSIAPASSPRPGIAAQASAANAAPPDRATDLPSGLQTAAEEGAWSMVNGTKDAEQLRRFIKRFPRASHHGEAEQQIAALERPATPGTQPRPDGDVVTTVDRPAFGSPGEAEKMVERVLTMVANSSLEATINAINSRPKQFQDRDLYPFIIYFNGVEPVNVGTPEVRGQNRINSKDPDGKFLVRDMIALARREPGWGWYDYRWRKPNTKVVEYKVSYIRHIPGYEALVGVGVYKSEPLPNDNTIGVISGSPDSNDTNLQMAWELAEVLNSNDENKLRVLPVAGIGGTRSILDVRHLRGVDIGLTQVGVLNSFRKENDEMGMGAAEHDSIAYVAPLFTEEVHILARNGITSIAQLNGLKVNLGAAGGGTSYAMRDIFKRLGIVVQEIPRSQAEVPLSQAEAIEKVKSGEIDATVLIAGKPVRSMSHVAADGLHFVPIRDAERTSLGGDYTSAVLSHDDYPGLIPDGQQVETVAARAVMITFNWPKTNNDRYPRITRFVEQLFKKIDDLKKPPYHPKWQDVNLAARVPGWKRFEAAQNLLDSQPLAAEQRNQIPSGGQPPRGRPRQRP